MKECWKELKCNSESNCPTMSPQDIYWVLCNDWECVRALYVCLCIACSVCWQQTYLTQMQRWNNPQHFWRTVSETGSSRYRTEVTAHDHQDQKSSKTSQVPPIDLQPILVSGSHLRLSVWSNFQVYNTSFTFWRCHFSSFPHRKKATRKLLIWKFIFNIA